MASRPFVVPFCVKIIQHNGALIRYSVKARSLADLLDSLLLFACI